VIVDCAHYRDGKRQHEGPMELGAAAEICAGKEGFVWLGLFEPSEAELADVQRQFGLHELAVEDAQTLHLRPKIERYEEGHVLFAVFRIPLRHHRSPGRGERVPALAAATGATARAAQRRTSGRAVGDYRHDR